MIGLNSPQDYLALLVRRKWWVIVPFIALSCAIGLVTYLLPKTYVSDTLTLLRPRDVPDDFVRDLIAGTAEQRLGAIEQSVLSRTNLILVLQEFEKQMPEFHSLNEEQKVQKLRNQIQVYFQQDRSRASEAMYFQISYAHQNPSLAQQIADKLTSLFIEQDNRTREDQVTGTMEFLSAELEKVSEQLKQSETHLKELKTNWRYELPDQLDTNLRTLDRLGLQKQANAEALDRYATIRLNLERQISETPQFISPQAPPSGSSSIPAPNPLLEQYEKKRFEFEQLSAKYTERHPDVQAAKAEMERLKTMIPLRELASLDDETDAPPAARLVPNPLYRSLTAQLQEVKTEFQIREREKQLVESEIETYNQRVQNSPQSEQEIAAVLRQNTDLTKQYDDLKAKLTQARLAESLESKDKGSQFVIVDRANYPLEAVKPNKLSIILGGTILSLLIGVLVALAADVFGQKVWTQAQVEAFTGVPVLTEIPPIVTDSDLASARRKRFVHAGSSLAIAAAYAVCLYLIYLNQTIVLRYLDPIIQRLL